jgi:hypothetical protein
MFLTDFAAGAREIFLLRAARAKVEGYGEARLAQIREHKRIAGARLTSSRRVANAHAALELLDVALDHALRAAHVAEGKDETYEPPPPRAPAEGFAQAEAQRNEMEARVANLLASVESRTETELDGLRVGRFAAIAVVLFVCGRALALHYGVHNVALHKPVAASSVAFSKPATGITDGRTRDTFGVHTNEGPHPFVTIDLERTYRIRKIRVFNRGDGWFDEVLPLSIELSTDGTTFHEIARRTTHFDVWDIDAGMADARWVRATKDSGYIALNEIEVYSRE